ncbi:hypothetical protein Rsub_04162 [Raphidocelis subcapitata]|uniref:Uncharacterized protein n=1 Tax=Raphidocelis subcapitata TaxID=307507 RepID=A0A2V0NXM2_9CHLO|nr:hypothetical protein Rsub_04162 [Raphidocelis subcapitata]|eukprot:GBF91422.1 hypothetical protein Rsub_04162 [Raphidocelis subcapitata]
MGASFSHEEGDGEGEGRAGAGGAAAHAQQCLAPLVPILLARLAPPPGTGAGSGGAAAACSASAHPVCQLRLVNRAACRAVDHATVALGLHGGRHLRGLCAAGGRFERVRELRVSVSGAADVRVLAEAAVPLGRGLPALRSLVVAAHPRASALDDGAAAATALASKLCALPGLERLAVRVASLPPQACDALISGAACLPDLVAFELASPAGWDGSDALRAALGRPATWRRLEELSLVGIDAAGLEALAAASHLQALAALCLTACGSGASAAAAARAAAAAGKRDADAAPGGSDSDAEGEDGGDGDNDSSHDGDSEDADAEVWCLASAAWWDRLTALSLDSCRLRDLAPLPPRLEALSLAGNRLGSPAAAALAGACLPRLRELSLAGNARIGARGAAALAAAGWARGGCGGGCGPAGMERLSLAGTAAGDEGACALIAALRGLRALDVSAAGVTDATVAAIAAAAPDRLEALNLSGGPLRRGLNVRLGRDRTAWRKLAVAPLWALRRLDLRAVALTPPAALELGAAVWLPRLDALLLPDDLDHDALTVLRSCPGFAHLERAGRVAYGARGRTQPQRRRRAEDWADGVGLFEEAMGAAAVAAAAAAAVAMALSSGSRH